MIQFAIAGLPKFKQGDTQIYGMAGTGTFAEEMVVPEQAAIKIDDDVPFEIASLIGCGVTTGVGAAINTAKVDAGLDVRGVRLWRGGHLGHPGLSGGRRGRDRRRRLERGEARDGQAVRCHACVRARRSGRAARRGHR